MAWAEGGQLLRRAFIPDRGEELAAAGPLKLSLIRPAKVKDSTVADIASPTDLDIDHASAQLDLPSLETASIPFEALPGRS